MGVRLTITTRGSASGQEEPRVVSLQEERITIGRDQTCEVVLAQPSVSRAHARLSREGDLSFLEDLGSSYGTRVNGDALPKKEKRLLRNGDVIAIAQFDITFEAISELAESASDHTSMVARRAVKNVMRGLSAEDTPYLRVMNGASEGQRIELHEGREVVFGRDEATVDFVLAGDLVSRRHAKVRRDWSGVTLEDLKSRNGVRVNQRRAERATLENRDEIEIGGTRLLFVDPGQGESDSLVAAASAQAPAPEEEPPPPSPQPPPAAHLDPPPPQPPAPVAPPPVEEQDPEPSKLFDFSQRQTLVALAVGGTVILAGIVVLALIIAGA